MTPSARFAAAIEILDRVAEGHPVEQVLTTWARGNRYAGSGDRAAIRDIVFDITRQRRSAGWVGGGEDGRALVLGHLRLGGGDPASVFSGERFAPAPLTDAETVRTAPLEDAPRAVRLDMQDWVVPLLDMALGDRADEVARVLRHRAPVMLRVNSVRTTRDEVAAVLAEAGFDTEPVPLSATALMVPGRVRGLQATEAFKAGLFEFQDAASQAVVDRLATGLSGARVLDYCAGGGGKSLALAASGARVTAHDAYPQRMSDLNGRAARAGVAVEVATRPEGVFDLVLCDAPCSGSGAWRRQPEGKWRLGAARLTELTAIQDGILDEALTFVAPGGRLAFATCSLFAEENEARADAFVARHPDWREVDRLRLSPLDGGDGFFLAVFTRV